MSPSSSKFGAQNLVGKLNKQEMELKHKNKEPKEMKWG